MRSPPTGPEDILEIADPSAGLSAFIVIDSTLLGPAFGGIRLRAYAQERDALLEAMDLASAMTIKSALARLPCGGGKIVVIDRPGLRRDRALAAVARALNSLGGRFFAGPDYGLSSADLSRLRRHSRFVAREPRGRQGSLAEATSRGVIAAMRAALAFEARAPRYGEGPRGIGSAEGPGGASRKRSGQPRRPSSRLARDPAPSLAGTRVAVQGLGSVGCAIVRRLVAEGATVLGADVDAAAAARGAALGARIVTPGRLVSAPVDLFVPSALGRTLDESFAARCRSRIVCGPANNALASRRVEEILVKRGVVVVPEAVAGAGALIAGALRHLGRERDTSEAIDRIGPRTLLLLEQAKQSRQLPSETARQLALLRLRQVRTNRRIPGTPQRPSR